MSNVVQDEPTEKETIEYNEITKIEQQAQKAYNEKDWVAAEAAYQKLVENLRQESEPWFRLGNVYTRTNRPDEAIYAYQQSLNINPNNTKAWNNLGVTQLRQATNTFVNMQQHMHIDNPLNDRVNNVVEVMTDLMENGFNSNDQTKTNE